jgi:hypothetical protein
VLARSVAVWLYFSIFHPLSSYWNFVNKRTRSLYDGEKAGHDSTSLRAEYIAFYVGSRKGGGPTLVSSSCRPKREKRASPLPAIFNLLRSSLGPILALVSSHLSSVWRLWCSDRFSPGSDDRFGQTRRARRETRRARREMTDFDKRISTDAKRARREAYHGPIILRRPLSNCT